MHKFISMLLIFTLPSFATEGNDHRPLKRIKPEEATGEHDVAIPALNLAEFIVDQASHETEFYCDRCQQHISTDDAIDPRAHMENFHKTCWQCGKNFDSGSKVRQHLILGCLSRDLLRKQ